MKKLNLTESEKEKLKDIINRFEKAHVLVIGDFILDQFVWGSVDRISPEAPVPVVNVSRESYMPGGSLNVAHNIRSMDGAVFPCGVLGRDLYGRLLVKAIKKEGIDIGGIVYDEERPTTLKTRVIAHSQQVVRFDKESTGDISQKDLKKIIGFIEKKISKMDVVILEDYGKGLIQKDFVKKIISICKKHKKPILVDPKEKHFAFYEGATLMTPNRKEAFAGYEALHGAGPKQPDVEALGHQLIKKLKLDSLLLTLGEDGMALFQKGKRKVYRIPTIAHEVYDVSGAGDTVIATLAMSLGVGATKEEAAMLSNIAAGIVVEKLGTAIATREELKKTIDEL